MNWYAYCGNKPTKFIDPSGLAMLAITDDVYGWEKVFPSKSTSKKSSSNTSQTNSKTQKLQYPTNNVQITTEYKDAQYLKDNKFEHYGLDLGSKSGEEIYAAGNGKVLYTGKNYEMGNMIDILYHNVLIHDGSIQSILVKYAHLADGTTTVKAGDMVSLESGILGIMGHTGYYAGDIDHHHVETILYDPDIWDASSGVMYPTASLERYFDLMNDRMLDPIKVFYRIEGMDIRYHLGAFNANTGEYEYKYRSTDTDWIPYK